jgi:uncharacterized protein YrrD
LRKARDLIGLPVLAVDSGKQVGNAKDLLIDPTWHIMGIVLDTKYWFSSLRYVEKTNIIACGEDAITIPNENAIHKLDDDINLYAFIGRNGGIKGLPVITVGGHQLGMVEDVYLEQDWGKQIVGYELSEGFLSDVRDGRKWLPLPKQAIRGEDAIIVPVHCAVELEETFAFKEE